MKKSITTIVFTLCVTFFATSKLFCQDETKKWNVALSNAYFANQMDNIQFEFERKFERISVGLYAQFQNYVIEFPNTSYEYDYLPQGGFMSNGTSFQTGLQVSRHFLKPELKWDLWLKWRAGVSISNRVNYQGNYWYLNSDREKEYYTITEKQNKVFGNFETNIGVGLSRRIFDNFSVFIEPAFSFQLFLQEPRINKNNGIIALNLQLRYGVSYSF
jgi:hypothetical protein